MTEVAERADEYGRLIGQTTDGRTFRLRNWGESSAKYGPCMCCRKHVSEMHMQLELDERGYPIGYSLWGHESCLREARTLSRHELVDIWDEYQQWHHGRRPR